MLKLEFATNKDFQEQRQQMNRAWQSHSNSIKTEYKKQRKIFSGVPKGASK